IIGSGSISIPRALTSDRVTLAGTWTIGGTHTIRPSASLTNRTSTITTPSLAGAPGNRIAKLNLHNKNPINAGAGGATTPRPTTQQAPLAPWNGPGGGTPSPPALAAATTSTATALGYATGTQFTAGNGQTALDGFTINPTDTIVLYTLAGDANM